MPQLRPTPSFVLAALALVLAVGGTSYAAATVTGKDIKNNSITGKDIKNKSVTGKDVKDKSLTGKDLKDGSVSAADLASGVLGAKAVGPVRAVAASGPNFEAARAAAPEIVLFSKGALSVVAKCFTATAGPTTYAETYIKTSVAGAIFDSRSSTLDGGATADTFLNPGSDEDDRDLESTSTGPNSSAMDAQDDSDFTAFAPDGTVLRGFTGAAVKNGTLAAGNGVYGAGDACLFTAAVFSN